MPHNLLNVQNIPNNERLRLDHQLCFALYRSSSMMTKLYAPHLKKLNLTYPQYLVLLSLWQAPSKTVGEIAAELGQNFGTLSPLLKRMEAKGLIKRQREPDDERRVNIQLTQLGLSLRQPALDMQTAMGCELNMPIEQLTQLRESVQTLINNLSKIDTNPENSPN